MRRFDPEVYGNNQQEGDSLVTQGGRRDPYFEQYTYDMYQSLAENPSALFNFFVENNDIFRKIDDTDMKYMYKRWAERRDYMGWAAIGTIASVLVYDKVIMPRIYPNQEFRLKKFRLLAFTMKFAVLPLLATRLVDWKMDIGTDYQKIAEKYNFGYDDFNSAMNVLERAKLMGHLDELQEQRGNFDFRKLEAPSNLSK